MTSRLLAALAAAALSCATLPVAHARTYLAPTALLGKGAYVHQFVLRDPVTHQPLPNARYRLFLPGQVIAGLPPKEPRADSVVFGTTDAAGRTVRIRLPKRHPDSQWVINPIAGEGDMGETFRLADADDKSPIRNYSYVIDVKDTYLVCGRTDSRGNTYFVESQKPHSVSLHETYLRAPADTDWCAGPGLAIANGANDADAADLYTQYFGTLVANGNALGTALRQRIAAKLIALAIAARDPARIDAALDLEPIVGDERNGIGYDLADANLKVDRALDLIDAHLADSPDDAFALDSKGWALHRLDRNEEALTWFDRSTAEFARDAANGTPDEDTREARALTLTHKGEVLWDLGRRDEARDAFAQARQIQPDNAVLAAALKRLAISAGDNDTKTPETASQ
ncbi:MAG: tetratricopeptide repeat protein [Burkholderia sp.]|uniref:tetratricopeptide repeat protein n=1 Tax=Burkholderia sp. TaxID=36773 RepID=UPI00283693C4|nr:tetratricopeptide repeat protein [Burkholderia sp.]MDR0246349.1 tetratricopeptide repeat protein [Burkholderia sp.]